MKQQLIILSRSQLGASNLSSLERFLLGFGYLIGRPGRTT